MMGPVQMHSCSLWAAPAHTDEAVGIPPAPTDTLRCPVSILMARALRRAGDFSTLRSRFRALAELIISEFLVHFLKSIEIHS